MYDVKKIVNTIKLIPVTPIRISYTLNVLLGRAVLSGIVISMGVLAAKLLGPVWGGIFATFPALTISTVLITYKSNGIEFTKHIMKNILVSITINLGIFAIFVRFGYAIFGIWSGTIIAYLATGIITYFLYSWRKRYI